MAHDTPEKAAIAAQHTVLRCQVGSGLHGVIIEDTDDRDEMGLVIEPPEYTLGLKRFEQYEFRSRGRYERSGPGDLDYIAYGLRKWAGLAAAGNPTVLLVLFAPQDQILSLAWPGRDLRNKPELVLSRQAGPRFLGYLQRQRARMTGELSQRTNRPELVARYGFDCYLDDTEFLTRRGWLLYDRIVDEDLLATVNPETGQIEFQAPLDRVEKPYSGPILFGKTFYSHWAVTPNHRMRVAPILRGPCGINPRTPEYAGRWAFRRAEDVTRLQWFQQVAGMPSIVEYPVSDAYLALIGAYVSEGSVGKRRLDGRASVLRFDQKEGGRLHATMAVVGQRWPLRTYRYHRGQRGWITTWSLADVDLANEIVKACGAGSKVKRLPSWVLDLSGRQSNVLIEAMMNGDGTPHRTGGWVYYTSSPRLADDIQAVAILAGRRANVRGPYESAGMFQVLIHDAGANPYAPFVGRKVRPERVEDRRIVCFTVPNEILVTRRNGHVAMHGNTKFAFHALRLGYQGCELMQTGRLTLPVPAPAADFLLQVRQGKVSQDLVLERIAKFAATLSALIADGGGPLPDRPDYDVLNEWLAETYRAWWSMKCL